MKEISLAKSYESYGLEDAFTGHKITELSMINWILFLQC